MKKKSSVLIKWSGFEVQFEHIEKGEVRLIIEKTETHMHQADIIYMEDFSFTSFDNAPLSAKVLNASRIAHFEMHMATTGLNHQPIVDYIIHCLWHAILLHAGKA